MNKKKRKETSDKSPLLISKAFSCPTFAVLYLNIHAGLRHASHQIPVSFLLGIFSFFLFFFCSHSFCWFFSWLCSITNDFGFVCTFPAFFELHLFFLFPSLTSKLVMRGCVKAYGFVAGERYKNINPYAL